MQRVSESSVILAQLGKHAGKRNTVVRARLLHPVTLQSN